MQFITTFFGFRYNIHLMSELKTEIGKRIASTRKEQGDSQTTCAAKLGIKRATLAAYETGNNTMPDDIKSKFVSLYQISYDYLISGILTAEEPAPIYQKKDLLSLLDQMPDNPLNREIKARVNDLISQNIEQKEKIISLLEELSRHKRM